jgi:hypothetical protein
MVLQSPSYFEAFMHFSECKRHTNEKPLQGRRSVPWVKGRILHDQAAFMFDDLASDCTDRTIVAGVLSVWCTLMSKLCFTTCELAGADHGQKAIVETLETLSCCMLQEHKMPHTLVPFNADEGQGSTQGGAKGTHVYYRCLEGLGFRCERDARLLRVGALQV